MRVTNNMLVNSMMYTINGNLARMDELQNQLATGKKIVLPSDDPIVASRALKFRSTISEIEQYQRNTDDALSWTEITDSTLNSMGDVIHRARELAVQAASDTNSGSDKQKIKVEVEQLKDQLIKLANTTYAGRYIFSGYKTDQPLILENDATKSYTSMPAVTDGGGNFRLPHDKITSVSSVNGDLGGTATSFIIAAASPPVPGEVYIDPTTGIMEFDPADVAAGITNLTADYTVDRVAGDYNPDVYTFMNMTQTAPLENENIQFEIGVGDKINVNVVGSNIFGGTSGATSTGLHIGNLMKFIDGLDTNNAAAINQGITDLDSFTDSILQQRADVGARSNRLDLTKTRLGDDNVNINRLMSDNEDADIAEVIMKLKNQENIYKASLEGGARIIQPTLLDFLR